MAGYWRVRRTGTLVHKAGAMYLSPCPPKITPGRAKRAFSVHFSESICVSNGSLLPSAAHFGAGPFEQVGKGIQRTYRDWLARRTHEGTEILQRAPNGTRDVLLRLGQQFIQAFHGSFDTGFHLNGNHMPTF